MSPSSEVFAPREIARAAGVSEEAVSNLISTGAVRTIRTARRAGPFVDGAEALRVTAALIEGRPVSAGGGGPRLLFSAGMPARQARSLFAASSGLHVAVVVTLVIAASATGPAVTATPPPKTDTALIYLTLAGPGGGGGGGGARTPVRPPRAERRGLARTSSPIPPRIEPPAMIERPTAAPPEASIDAPVEPSPADLGEAPGVLEAPPEPATESRGPGAGGGTGAGAGTGMGDGGGGGIGPGEGSGTGGGPYRPGSGVEPPTLLREVKPLYTEAARLNGVQGEVLMELVVRQDGSVGDVRIVRGLGHGLDERALDAVRQWRFAAARRMGVAVDVVVEVAMEFRLR